MLPTPSTSHVSFSTIYEPSEDSYLFLDTLSSTTESTWLKSHFDTTTTPPSPLILEVGTGSGVVLAFLTANSHHILGRTDVLALGTDVNRNACVATRQTVVGAIDEQQQTPTPSSTTTSTTSPLTSEEKEPKGTTRSIITSTLLSDLASPLRPGTIDILLFNPPYVPTPDLPEIPTTASNHDISGLSSSERFARESYLLSLTYAGGKDGMETTDRLLRDIPRVLAERGVAYVLLCAQNRPREVVEGISRWECAEEGGRWCAEVVGSSGVQAGWEKLVIVRVWREYSV
ncbi:methyltransferase [Aspergillus sclerotioniger CBS 115572]|uniref:Methyltransferase n=1 Tax=Aspergillus sclerotioniger CBS 115572 TaxID=1450535 RepID=A0A317V1X5_9EURO|nr:methyltransferase [Aspergillus sclerotioniger CBS 115572]PWY68075.1 methyltransferase [Aspergillus sclerotioniger CBS 115572]